MTNLDDKTSTLVDKIIDEACECFDLAEDWHAWANCDFNYAKKYFREVLTESIENIIKEKR